MRFLPDHPTTEKLNDKSCGDDGAFLIIIVCPLP
jgi:hypothetical protein